MKIISGSADLEVLVLPLILVRSLLFPLLVFGHCIEVDLLTPLRDLDKDTLRKGDGVNWRVGLTLTIGVINSTRNLGTLSSDG